MKILDKFPVQEGLHCASTSLSEIMKYNGYDFSEAFVFGISSGLDFIYLNQFYKSHCRLVFTRTPMLENEFFNNIGVQFKWNRCPLEYIDIVNNINKGNPLLVQADPSILEFFDVQLPSVAGHTLTIIGYDYNKNLSISDSIGSEIFSCSYENLCEAINVEKPPFYIRNIWSVVNNIEIKVGIEEIIFKAMKKNALKMLNPPTVHSGIKAIYKLYNEIPQWKYLDNYDLLCNHVYNSIENIGTGGSGFRNIYGDFLNEIDEFTSEIDIAAIIKKIFKLGKLYRELSKYFYLEYRDNGKTYVDIIQTLLLKIIESESDFWGNIYSNC